MKPSIVLALLGLVPFITALPAAGPEAINDVRTIKARTEEDPEYDYIYIQKDKTKRTEDDPEYDYIIIQKDKTKRTEDDPEYDYIIIQKEKARRAEDNAE